MVSLQPYVTCSTKIILIIRIIIFILFNKAFFLTQVPLLFQEGRGYEVIWPDISSSYRESRCTQGIIYLIPLITYFFPLPSFHAWKLQHSPVY